MPSTKQSKFLISPLKHIGFLLEVPQHMFSWRNKKDIIIFWMIKKHLICFFASSIFVYSFRLAHEGFIAAIQGMENFAVLQFQTLYPIFIPALFQEKAGIL